MIRETSVYRLELDDVSGAIRSLRFLRSGRELIGEGNRAFPLFLLYMRDGAGNMVKLSPAGVRALDTQAPDAWMLSYEWVGGQEISVAVRVSFDGKDAIRWRLSLENRTDLTVDSIHFPHVVVPNDLVGAGGDAAILWPAMEGVLVHDLQIRENGIIPYGFVGYPSKGWEGLYPGPCPSQCLAYYGKDCGLYLAAEDTECSVKAIEYYGKEGGVALEIRLFPGAWGRGAHEMGYPMVMRVFEGDWHTAADMYREWFQTSAIAKPPKLTDAADLPAWLDDSPVTAIYPIRGQMHFGDMSVNSDFYPFTKALDALRRLSQATGSRVMSLPMQWEGTAPWAPPYVWPPLGGEDAYRAFVDALHRDDNLAGLYCSGIAWTNQSNLIPAYECQREFDERHLIDIMCAAPDGSTPNSLICNGPIRTGYDMCPANEFVAQTSTAELRKIVSSGCDYVQYFDQNLGGAASLCYSKEHGHPPAPGLWQNRAMSALLDAMAAVCRENGRNVVLGCEAGAAEPYMRHLRYNDLRFEINYHVGTPVPFYAYVYHEYINNFMGNQNMSCMAIDIEQSPLSLLQRITHSFIAGDMLSLVLRDHGEIHWDWCTSWEVEKPEQRPIIDLVRNYNAWRKGLGKPYLRFGRMLKPAVLAGTYDIPMVLRNGKRLSCPSLSTSRWAASGRPEGESAQFIANYTHQPQSCTLMAEEACAAELFAAPDANTAVLLDRRAGGYELTLEPLSAVMVRLYKESPLVQAK